MTALLLFSSEALEDMMLQCSKQLKIQASTVIGARSVHSWSTEACARLKHTLEHNHCMDQATDTMSLVGVTSLASFFVCSEVCRSPAMLFDLRWRLEGRRCGAA